VNDSEKLQKVNSLEEKVTILEKRLSWLSPVFKVAVTIAIFVFTLRIFLAVTD